VIVEIIEKTKCSFEVIGKISLKLLMLTNPHCEGRPPLGGDRRPPLTKRGNYPIPPQKRVAATLGSSPLIR
jgi:hypothetical protein